MNLKNHFINVFTIVAVAPYLTSFAGEFSVKVGDQAPPAQISDAIRSVLSSKPIQVLEGDKPILNIWFRQEIPLKSKPSSPAHSLDGIAEATLMAAVSVEGSGLSDYKDNTVPKGVFVARYVLQPQDGDHLGTAEFNNFLVLIAPDQDKALDTFTKFTPMVKASGKLTPSGHPMIVSLRPSASDAANPSLIEPTAEHKAVHLKLPGKTESGDKADLVFDLVIQGHGHIQ